MLYKVELRYFYGWDDAEWTEETDAGITPMRFHTINQAQAAIDEFLAAVKMAVIAGDMEYEEARDDYRIVETNE